MRMLSGATFVETRRRRGRNRIGKYELQIEIECLSCDFDGVALWLDLQQFEQLWSMSTEVPPVTNETTVFRVLGPATDI